MFNYASLIYLHDSTTYEQWVVTTIRITRNIEEYCKEHLCCKEHLYCFGFTYCKFTLRITNSLFTQKKEIYN